MTPPAEHDYNATKRQTGVPFEELSTDDKLGVLFEHITYLSYTVQGLMQSMHSNPAMRMMMGRKTR